MELGEPQKMYLAKELKGDKITDIFSTNILDHDQAVLLCKTPIYNNSISHIFVFKGLSSKNTEFLLKRIDIPINKPNIIEKQYSEFQILKKLGKDHPHFAKFYDIEKIELPEFGIIRIEIIIEFPGNLLSESLGKIQNNEILMCAGQILHAYRYLENSQLDLKFGIVLPQNIGFKDGICKICFLDTISDFNENTNKIAFLSPEILQNNDYDIKIFDVFSWAMVIYQLFSNITYENLIKLRQNHSKITEIEYKSDFLQNIEKSLLFNLNFENSKIFGKILIKCVDFSHKNRCKLSELIFLISSNSNYKIYNDLQAQAKFYYLMANSYLINLGDIKISEEYAEKSLLMRKNALGEQNLETADSYDSIGNLYCNSKIKSEQDKSIENYLKSLLIRKKLLGDDNKIIAISYNNLGLVYKNRGDLSKSLEFFIKATTIYEKECENSLELAYCYDNIGLIHKNLNQNSQSLDYFNKSLKLKQSLFPDENQEIGNSYNNIGLIYKSLGKYSESITNILKSLSIRQKILSMNHPDIGASYNNLGIVYEKIGDIKKARDCYLKSLQIKQSLPGNNNNGNEIAILKCCLANCYENLRDFQKSIENYEKALEIRIKINGEISIEVAKIYENIGMIMKNGIKNYEKAIENFMKALKIFEKVYEKPNSKIAEICDNLGLTYMSIGDIKKPNEYLMRSFNIRKQNFGENTKEIAISYRNLAELHMHKGENKEAYENYMKAMKITRKQCGEKNIETANSYLGLAKYYDKTNNFKESVENIDKAILILKEILGKEHPQISDLYKKLGNLYEHQGDILKSKESYEISYNILSKILENGHEDLEEIKKIISKFVHN